MNNLTILHEDERRSLFDTLALQMNLPAVAVEKDWWVTAVLRALFDLPYADHLSFKGGTSLSKCWNLIERFSEDVDIAINREFLGFVGTLSKTQIRDKLRRASCSFVRDKLRLDVAKQLETNGINPDYFSVNVNVTPVSTTDPEIIEIPYKTLFVENPYIKPLVKLEIGGRSMREPLEKVRLQSFVDEAFPKAQFAELPFEVLAVVPERTFIEKICLLHEEFAKPKELARTERMSRHLYDLARMNSSPVAENALSNKRLYDSIVEHRRVFIGLKGFDYDTLAPNMIRIVPPDTLITRWKADYETMRETMIYGDSPTFGKLMDIIKSLNEKVNLLDL